VPLISRAGSEPQASRPFGRRRRRRMPRVRAHERTFLRASAPRAAGRRTGAVQIL